MTIKKRIFFSNIRMALFTLAGFISVPMIIRIVMYAAGVRWIDRPDPRFQEIESHGEWKGIVALLFLALVVTIIGIINSFLTYRLTKSIVSPLEPLGEGVRQIHDNNLAYRITYTNEDEFRPVCDAFNEMAAKLEESARRRQKDEANRRELIAGISHDLRTPLTAIKGYLEGLETGVASTPEMRRNYLSGIKNKTAGLEHIIEQLFLFSKLDMDEFPLAMRRVDICLALRDMVEEAAGEYEIRGLAIQLAGLPENIFVSADSLWLRSVIINILENSVQYKTKELGTITISVSTVNDSALLRFADDGPGVPADSLPKLFDVFYRADPSRNKKGSGLGLAISAKIIERMGGTIHAGLPSAGGLELVIRMPVLRPEAAAQEG